MPHGLAVSGTKFNISKVKVKDYAHQFFCHFIYGTEQFTAYIKLERPGKRSHLDKMVINDAYFSVSLTTPYLEIKLRDVPLMYRCAKWAMQLNTFLCEFFCRILSKIKDNSTFNLLCLLSFSVLGNINERLQFIWSKYETSVEYCASFYTLVLKEACGSEEIVSRRAVKMANSLKELGGRHN